MVAANPETRLRRVRVFGMCLIIALFEVSLNYNNPDNYYLLIFAAGL